MFNKKPLTYILASMGIFGVLGLSTLAGIGHFASQKESSFAEESPLDSLMQVVVARVGGVPVSAREFMTSYETGPAFVKRENRPNPRLAHLDWMIKEKIMALDGIAHSVDKTPDIRLLLSEIQADRAVEEMYKADILSQVEVSDQALGQAVEEFAVKVWFKYIQVEDGEQALAILEKLSAGASFDSLSVSGHNPANQDPLSLWDIRHQDPLLAEQLMDLEIGAVSDIIKTEQGYFLARVDQVFKDPFLTPAKLAEDRRKLEVKLRQLKADSIAFQYAASRLEEANAVIKRDAFNQLFSYFEALDVSGDRDLDKLVLGNWPGALDRSGIEESMPVTLIATRNEDHSISEFFDWYDLRRYPVQGSSPAIRANQLKSIIWRMLRDRLLAKEAVERGFTENPAVIEEVEWWREKFSYWEVREQLLKDVVPSVREVDQALREYAHRYTHSDSSKNREEALKELYTLNERNVLRDFFEEKSGQHDIWIDTLALLSLPIQSDRLSKPIEMVAFKKEGTFPRIAYPTIDRVWERY